MVPTLLRFTNVMVAAILAGVSFGIWAGFNPTRLSAAAYLEQQQNMLQSLRVLMVVLVVVATLLSAVSAIANRRERGAFIGLLFASALFASCIVITVLGNRPLDEMVLAWTPTTLPDNWAEHRDRWWTFHTARTVVEVLALALVSAASIRRGAPLPPSR